MAALEGLIEDGIPADRLMPGTGLTALPDTQKLSAHAVGLGCAAVMILPSFFYRAVGDDGQARYFSALIEDIADPRLRIILYNIPQNSGVAVSPALARRLSDAFPDTITAYKDSAGDWANTKAVIAAAPAISVFPGSEQFLAAALAAGGSGCISATVNVNPNGIRTVYDGLRSGRDVAAAERRMTAIREAVQRAGLIAGIKAVLAVGSGDRRWLNLRPPHRDADWATGEALATDIAAVRRSVGTPQ